VVHGSEGALHVHADDRVEVVLGHREDHLVSQDAGVVHEHVEPAERLDRLVDHVLGAGEVGDVVVVGDGLATLLLDERGHLLGGAGVGALTGRGPAEVVHHDLGALRRELQRLAPPDAMTRAGDDRDLAVEHPHAHPPARATIYGGRRYACPFG
jgi:hypothetical protein